MSEQTCEVGDRVRLPSWWSPPTARGTVVTIDEHPLPVGVRVDDWLDRPIQFDFDELEPE